MSRETREILITLGRLFHIFAVIGWSFTGWFLMPELTALLKKEVVGGLEIFVLPAWVLVAVFFYGLWLAGSLCYYYAVPASERISLRRGPDRWVALVFVAIIVAIITAFIFGILENFYP